MFESILLPINSTKDNPQRKQTAINFSRKTLSRVIILSLSEDKSPPVKTYQAITYALTIFKDLISQDGLICDVVHRKGKPEFIICKLANELNVDLIVIGAKGIDLLKDSKNTTSKTLGIAPCPVLIVP